MQTLRDYKQVTKYSEITSTYAHTDQTELRERKTPIDIQYPSRAFFNLLGRTDRGRPPFFFSLSVPVDRQTDRQTCNEWHKVAFAGFSNAPSSINFWPCLIGTKDLPRFLSDKKTVSRRLSTVGFMGEEEEKRMERKKRGGKA
jgi:hypothetical protein